MTSSWSNLAATWVSQAASIERVPISRRALRYSSSTPTCGFATARSIRCAPHDGEIGGGSSGPAQLRRHRDDTLDLTVRFEPSILGAAGDALLGGRRFASRPYWLTETNLRESSYKTPHAVDWADRCRDDDPAGGRPGSGRLERGILPLLRGDRLLPPDQRPRLPASGSNPQQLSSTPEPVREHRPHCSRSCG